MTGKEPFVIGYPTLTRNVSLEAPAYGWLQLPLVEPDPTNASFCRKVAAPILQCGVTCVSDQLRHW